MSRARHLACTLAACSAVCCSGGGAVDAGAPDEPWEPGPLHGPCEMDRRVGRFEIAHEPLQSSVSGSVAEGVLPAMVLEQVGASGDCVLLRYDNPLCDPACEAGQTCDHDGSCIPFPGNLDVGVVTVDGLLAAVQMHPTGAGRLYYDTDLPHPVFGPGDPIRLVASGGEVAGFTLHGEGVEPLELLGDVWNVVGGSGLDVAWVPAAGGSATILVTLNLDQHGLSPATLVCECADTGTMTVPPELVTQLLDSGISGLPSGSVYRRTVDSASVEPGCVELAVFSHRSVDVVIGAP